MPGGIAAQRGFAGARSFSRGRSNVSLGGKSFKPPRKSRQSPSIGSTVSAWGDTQSVGSQQRGSNASDKVEPIRSDKRKLTPGGLTPGGGPADGGLPPNNEALKDRIRSAIIKPTYDVTDFYHETGLWQKIARHTNFENLTLVVITLNAVFIAVDTDNNKAATLLEAEPFFQICEHLFCLFFSFEWFARFMAFRRKQDCVQDFWFIFDSCLVGMMVLETWVMTVVLAASSSTGGAALGQASILRLFRLLRLTRITRLMRMIPELMILCKGMVAGMRSVLTVMCLQMVAMYVFAIAFTQLTGGTVLGAEFFPSVGMSLYSLLIYGVFLDSLEVICEALEENTTCLALFFVFIILSALTIMNMLIGVLCEVVSAVSEAENDCLQVNNVTDKLQQVLYSLDPDNNGFVDKLDVMNVLGQREVSQALDEVNVDPLGIVDFLDYIYDQMKKDDDGKIKYQDFIQFVLSLRGKNHVTVKDVVDLRTQILSSLSKMGADVAKDIQGRRLSAGSLSPKLTGLQLPDPFGGSARDPLGGSARDPLVGSARSSIRGEQDRGDQQQLHRLEEQVVRAEGLLIELSNEVKLLSQRMMPSPSPPDGRPQEICVNSRNSYMKLPPEARSSKVYWNPEFEIRQDLSASTISANPWSSPTSYSDAAESLLPNVPRPLSGARPRTASIDDVPMMHVMTSS